MTNKISNFNDYFNNYIQTNYGLGSFSQAVSYVISNPGKQIRANLCQQFCLATNSNPGQSWPTAMAIEMIHAYSLTHDDLPCMDNDSLRRGRPSAHVQFNESTALLIGDALLTDAFGVIVNDENKISNDQKIKIVSTLSKAVGSNGMVEGQYLDLISDRSIKNIDHLYKIHGLKTANLIAASCVSGILCSNDYLSKEFLHSAEVFGHNIGIAFQIVDDLIDSYENTGKTPNKDESNHKLSFTALMSEEQASSLAEKHTTKALEALNNSGLLNQDLEGIARSLLKRLK